MASQAEQLAGLPGVQRAVDDAAGSIARNAKALAAGHGGLAADISVERVGPYDVDVVLDHEAAAAIELEADGVTLASGAAWVRPAIKKMEAEFTEAEIMTIWNASMVLGGPEAVKRFIGTLVVEAPKESTAAAKVPREIPENYAYTLEALTLAVCERFGQDPATWPATLSAEQMAEYLAFERIRLHEEKVRDEILAGLLKMMAR